MRDTLIILAICISALAIGAFFFFWGPGEVNTPPLGDTNSITTQPILFSVLESGNQAEQGVLRKNYAAYDEESYSRLWAIAHGNDRSGMPFVDFNTSYVIGSFMGQKPSGGHSIRVQSVVDEENTRTVTIELTKPGSDCTVTEALTRPYEIIIVPLSSKELISKDIERTVNCSR